MNFEEYKIEKQKLVNFAQELTWDNKDKLFYRENPYSEQNWISIFDQTQFKTPQVLRYLMLTSLPYIIMEDSTTNIAAKAEQAKEILKRLWPEKLLTLPEGNFVDGTTHEVTYPTGILTPKYFVIGDAPGCSTAKDPYDHYGRVFTRGPSSQMIRLATIHIGIYFKCWFTNLSKQAMENNQPTTEAAILNQKQYLDFELQTLKPEAIIVLGKHAAEMLKTYYSLDIPIIQVTHPSYMARNHYSFKEYGDGIAVALEHQAGIILPIKQENPSKES
jgi:uracil-DNA glycosylase family 4